MDPGGEIISVFLPPFSKSSWRQIGIKAPQSAVSHHEIIQLTPIRPCDREEGRNRQGEGRRKDRNKTEEWKKTRIVNCVNTVGKCSYSRSGTKGGIHWKRGTIDRERSCEIRGETGSEEEEEFSKVNKDTEAGERKWVREVKTNRKRVVHITTPPKIQNRIFRYERPEEEKKRSVLVRT